VIGVTCGALVSFCGGGGGGGKEGTCVGIKALWHCRGSVGLGRGGVR